MKLLWLCNAAPGLVQQKAGKGGFWVDHVLTDLLARGDMEIFVLCPGKEDQTGTNGCLSWRRFLRGRPDQVRPELKEIFTRTIREFQPDVIHIWGTEFGHTLAMMEVCRELDLLDRTAISIQGLCTGVARHYNEGIPVSVQRGHTLRDLLRHDNLLQQQETFRRRGEQEQKALAIARHVIGRTHWDKACTHQLAPQAQYYFCGETMREEFYRDQWQYESCQKHRIFTPSLLYPVKGFHYALEALAIIRRDYPDTVLAVPGKNPTSGGWKAALRRDSYARYLGKLIEKDHLEDSIQYLGSLSGEEMKKQYLQANVFLLPSVLENSSNSLGEAMLLGVPAVAADVGGVTSMVTHGQEAFVYQSTAPYMLADWVEKVFALEDRAEDMGHRARVRACVTHDPERNLQALLEIYRSLGGKETAL